MAHTINLELYWMAVSSSYLFKSLRERDREREREREKWTKWAAVLTGLIYFSLSLGWMVKFPNPTKYVEGEHLKINLKMYYNLYPHRV